MPAIEIFEKHNQEFIEKQGINYELSLFGTEEIQQEIKKSASVAEAVLQKSVIATNNDTWLVLQAWEYQKLATYMQVNGKHGYFIPIEAISSLLKPESITRARRMLNYEFCKYLPTDPEVARRRKIKEQKYKDFFSDKKQTAKAIAEEWW